MDSLPDKRISDVMKTESAYDLLHQIVNLWDEPGFRASLPRRARVILGMPPITFHGEPTQPPTEPTQAPQSGPEGQDEPSRAAMIRESLAEMVDELSRLHHEVAGPSELPTACPICRMINHAKALLAQT